MWFLDGNGVAAYVSGFDAEGVVGKVDAGFDDVEDSGYAQRLAIVDGLSFFFGGIDVWGVKKGMKAMKGIECFFNSLLQKRIIVVGRHT